MPKSDQAYNSPTVIKNYNRGIILSFLLKHGECNRVGLSKEIGLSKPSISKAINELLEEGIIEEGGALGTTAIGRKPIIIYLKKNYYHVLGIDVGAREIRFSIGNLLGEVVFKDIIPISDLTKESIVSIKSLSDIIKKYISKQNYNIKTITIGVPAAVNSSTNQLVYSAIRSWENINIKERLQNYGINIPITIDNNVHLALLGEIFSKSALTYKNILYVYIGDGLGVSLFLNGRIYRGANGFAGEIDKFLLFPFDVHANNMDLTEKLSLQNYICGGALLRQAAIRKLDVEGIEEIFMKADSNNEIATEIIEESISILTSFIVNACTLYDPDAILIGGNIFKYYEKKLQTITKNVKDRLLRDIVLTKAPLNEDAGIVGAISSSLNLLKKEILHIEN